MPRYLTYQEILELRDILQTDFGVSDIDACHHVDTDTMISDGEDLRTLAEDIVLCVQVEEEISEGY